LDEFQKYGLLEFESLLPGRQLLNPIFPAILIPDESITGSLVDWNELNRDNQQTTIHSSYDIMQTSRIGKESGHDVIEGSRIGKERDRGAGQKSKTGKERGQGVMQRSRIGKVRVHRS
jgi:hypothetical protein